MPRLRKAVAPLRENGNSSLSSDEHPTQCSLNEVSLTTVKSGVCLKRTGEYYVVNRKRFLVGRVDGRGFLGVALLLDTLLLLGEEVQLALLLVLVRVVVLFCGFLDRLKVELTNSEIGEWQAAASQL